MQLTIGVDISKKTIDVALLQAGREPLRRKFQNKPSGFLELSVWVDSVASTSVVLALEATSTYGDNLALFGFETGWTVFVLNPARVKAYGLALGQKNKTDRVDCLTVGRFAQTTPGLMPWVPLTAARAELRGLVRERLHVQQLLQGEQTRQQTAPLVARKGIQERIQLLTTQAKELWLQIKRVLQQDPQLQCSSQLLATIPGIGVWSAAVLLSELPEIGPATSARQVAALFGLCPRIIESGTSVRGRTRLNGQGRRLLSHQLYMPALTALKHNALIRAWAEKLAQRGKKGKQIVAAVIHRLLRIAVGVLKNRSAFTVDWKGARA